MADEPNGKKEQNIILQVRDEPNEKEYAKSALIDELVARYSQVRQTRTRQAMAQLIELAKKFDLTDPHMAMLFQESLEDIFATGEELDADLKTHLEKLLGIRQEVEEPQVIEGEAIASEDG